MATNKNSSNNPLQGKQFSAPGQGEWPPAGGGALRERGGSDAGRGPASLSPLPELTPSVNEGGRDELKSVNTPREENGSRLPDSQLQLEISLRMMELLQVQNPAHLYDDQDTLRHSGMSNHIAWRIAHPRCNLQTWLVQEQNAQYNPHGYLLRLPKRK